MFYLASFSEDSKTLIVNRGLSVIVITFLKKVAAVISMTRFVVSKPRFQFVERLQRVQM